MTDPTVHKQRARLIKRGWLEAGTLGKTQLWTHLNLQWPWPFGDAVRLEHERSKGDIGALYLLGKLKT